MPEVKKEDAFCQRLKLIRKTLGITQKEMSTGLGISDGTMSEIFNGKHKPGYEFFIRITTEFNVNIYYLLFGKGEMFLSPTTHFSKMVEQLSVNMDDVQKMLWYFERSPIVQYMMSGYFRTILQNQHGAIRKEIEDYEAMRKRESKETSPDQDKKRGDIRGEEEGEG